MHVRQSVRELIAAGATRARDAGLLAYEALPAFEVEAPKLAEHGDLATNLAMLLAKPAKMAPRKIAEVIIQNLDAPEGMFRKVEIAGPGFINFFIEDSYWRQVITEIHRLGPAYGDSDLGAGQKVQVEFVSANPTGPLHIGHGRGAALGDALANLLQATGHQVEREYYINDVGLQINNLGRSLYFRLRELQGEKIELPHDCYQGAYMLDLARDYLAQGRTLPPEPPQKEDFIELGQFAGDAILAGIKKDLADFGVAFDHWFSETDLYRRGLVDQAFALLKEQDYLYEDEGALWFRASRFGDEKDRVVRRSNGVTTYFASDVAYHLEKFKRGYDLVVDIWGADHHGYVPRLQAAVEALGYGGRLKVILVQLVSLLRKGVQVAMTTRGGTFETLRDVIDEVGKDAARFIFLTRRPDAHLEFDLEVAKEQSRENQVYYVQYAYARMRSVLRKAAEQGIAVPEPDPARFSLLDLPVEVGIMKLLAGYPELVEGAARNLEPHRITYFLTDLATQLHSYYDKHRFISEDAALTEARLWLAAAVKTVLAHGLGILGVEAPKTM